MSDKVRNYDKPDPKRVVASIRKVLATKDIDALTHDAYVFIITHAPYIAHYDHNGFKSTFRNNLGDFCIQFLSQNWKHYLDRNGPFAQSYLYDVSYKGVMLADIMRDIIPLFEASKAACMADQLERLRLAKLRTLEGLAQDLGYEVRKKEDRKVA